MRARRAAADHDLFRGETVGAHGLEDQRRAERHALDYRSVEMRRPMLECETGDYTARIRIGVGRAVALEVVEYHQPFRARRQGLRLRIELVVADAFGQQTFEPVDDRTCGGLSTLDDVEIGNHRVGIGSPDTLAMQWFVADAELE